MTIDPDKFYAPNDVSQMEAFPWLSPGHPGTIKRWMRACVEQGNGEKFDITIKPGTGPSGDRYFIKGSGIIKIVAAFEDGSLFEGRT